MSALHQSFIMFLFNRIPLFLSPKGLAFATASPDFWGEMGSCVSASSRNLGASNESNGKSHDLPREISIH